MEQWWSSLVDPQRSHEEVLAERAALRVATQEQHRLAGSGVLLNDVEVISGNRNTFPKIPVTVSRSQDRDIL